MADAFPDTRWTLIQRARRENADPAALAEWCRSYWPPVFSYICAQGHDSDAAKEFAQGFFENLLVRGADACLPDRLQGAFRAYLMRSVKNYLTDQWRAARTRRKGGGTIPLPLEALENCGHAGASPDQAFDQAWALTILELAMKKLADEMERKGRSDFFHAAKNLVDGRSVNDGDRTRLAESVGMTDRNFRVALHRFRARFRTLIEDEVRQTVSSEDDFQEELRYLFHVWS
jgi:RNA polymerase sigma-70 factor (ECF subfamily)